MTAKILTYIAQLNSNSQYHLFNLKEIYNVEQELVPIKKYGKCYIQATTPQKNSPPHKWNGKVKPIR